MDPLTELAIKYNTDKWGKHHYTPVYFDLFKDKRETVKKVLEIGTAEGAGLKVFRDFFPNATIYGAEIDQKRVDMMKDQDRIEVIKCDQNNYDDLNDLITKIGGDLDLVIDDGSHNPDHQIFTALTLMRKLYFGAIYIIEDVSNTRAEEIKEKLYKFYPEMIKVGNRHDDRLIIMKVDQ